MTDLTSPRTFADGREGVELAIAGERLTHAYDRPRAFLDLLFADVPSGYRVEDGVAVVDVRGPLEQRGGWFWDGYDSVTERVSTALANPAVRAVVLSLDSPGGVVAGMLASARAIRAAADAAGKPLVAHADTWATSAAYGLAVAADHVSVTEDGALGSVGVITMVVDRTKMTEGLGLDVRVVRSGALKADPHPDVALTDASVARVRARVMELAQGFAAWVGERRGQTAEQLLAHQGATIYAARALGAGLADSVGTPADAVATARALADARDAERTNRMTDQNMRAQLDTLRASLAVETDAELPAAVSTLRKRAEAGDAAARERDALKAQLAERDARDLAAAREGVLAKHRQRGALTPALEADAAYMADLAPLPPEALDRVLGKLPGAAAPAQPRRAAALDPAAEASPEVTATDRRWARRAGVSEDAIKAAIAQEKRQRAAREGDDDEDAGDEDAGE